MRGWAMVEVKPSDQGDRQLKEPETKALASSDAQVIVNPSAKDKQLAEVDRTNKSSGSLTELNFKSQGLTREQILVLMEEQDESISIDYGDGPDASRKSGLTEKDLVSVGGKSYNANTVLAYDSKQSGIVSDGTSAITQEQNHNKNGKPYVVYSLEALQATRKLDPISLVLTQGNYQESVKLNVQITNVPEVSSGVKADDLLGFTNAVFDAGAKAVRPVEEHLARPNAINEDLWNLPGGAAKGIWHFAQSPEQLNKDADAITNKVIETIDKPMMPEQRAVTAGSLLPMFFFEGGGKPLDNAAAKQMKLDQMTAEELKMLGIEKKEMRMPEVPQGLEQLELQKATPELLTGMAEKGRQIVIATAGSEELAYMDAMYVNALARGVSKSEIWLRENPLKIAALEEFLHGSQARHGWLTVMPEEIAEVKVKDFMLRHQKLLGLTPNDCIVLQAMKQREIDYAQKRGFTQHEIEVKRWLNSPSR